MKRMKWKKSALSHPKSVIPMIMIMIMKHYCEKVIGGIKILIQLACGGGVEYCHIKRDITTVPSWNRDEIVLTTIRYVHQLQQALELIGAFCADTF